MSSENSSLTSLEKSNPLEKVRFFWQNYDFSGFNLYWFWNNFVTLVTKRKFNVSFHFNFFWPKQKFHSWCIKCCTSSLISYAISLIVNYFFSPQRFFPFSFTFSSVLFQLSSRWAEIRYDLYCVLPILNWMFSCWLCIVLDIRLRLKLCLYFRGGKVSGNHFKMFTFHLILFRFSYYLHLTASNMMLKYLFTIFSSR